MGGNLSVNLHKSEFGQATVNFLGHIVGQGYVKPVIAKMEAIINYPAPGNSLWDSWVWSDSTENSAETLQKL